jgi:hypothetical protein
MRSLRAASAVPQRLARCARKPLASGARPLACEAKPFFRYLSAWFCPFAHRATIALEHHRDRVDYEWVEALGWTRKETKVCPEKSLRARRFCASHAERLGAQQRHSSRVL